HLVGQRLAAKLTAVRRPECNNSDVSRGTGWIANASGCSHLLPMITLIVGTNRPDSSTRLVAQHLERIYAEMNVPLQVLDLAKLPPEIFSSTSYAEKPKTFKPFSDAVLQSAGLHLVTPEYNGGLKDPELVLRLKSQAEGFVDFVERLQQKRLIGEKKA